MEFILLCCCIYIIFICRQISKDLSYIKSYILGCSEVDEYEE